MLKIWIDPLLAEITLQRNKFVFRIVHLIGFLDLVNDPPLQTSEVNKFDRTFTSAQRNQRIFL